MKTAANVMKDVRFVLAMSMMAIFATPALAQDVGEPQYTLTAIEDSSHGQDVLEGRFELAVAELTSGNKRWQRTFETKTNLCVAYTKLGDFDNAAPACDAAVEAMRTQMRQPSSRLHQLYPDRRAISRYLAVALSNRGVLRALSGDSELAREDFLSAQSLGVLEATANTNLAKLDTFESEAG